MPSEARSVIESCRADANTKFVEGLASITTADLDTIEGALNAAESKIASLRSQLAEAAKVLGPFAEAASLYDPPEDGDDAWVAWASDFTQGHLRAARRLYEQITKDTTNG